VKVDSGFAMRGVLLMWLGAVGVVVYKEFGNPKNPDRPLPRPCKLIPPAIGYTGLGLMAQFLPTVAFLVAIGLTVSEVVMDPSNPATNIFQQLAGSITRENQAVAQAG
jgi:hypothetical protein